jgi:hypothetical protein
MCLLAPKNVVTLYSAKTVSTLPISANMRQNCAKTVPKLCQNWAKTGPICAKTQELLPFNEKMALRRDHIRQICQRFHLNSTGKRSSNSNIYSLLAYFKIS